MERSEHHILQSWEQNADAWTEAVRKKQIESRRLVTDQAIVDTIAAAQPRSVLDIGCGEGWLARTLASQGIQVLGVDAVAALIEQARNAGGATYKITNYDGITQGSLSDVAPFDTIVCNFSLFGKESVEQLVSYAPRLLHPTGRFVVQTLHPLVANGHQPYQDGWRTGSWQGFNQKFSNPAPWYFRTLESWVRLFSGSGLTVEEIQEPIHPQTQQPASIIFVSKRSD